MNILTTPLSRFENITDFPYKENYVTVGDFRMHYIDEGEGETILALHGEPTWCYLYRKFIPILENYRFIAPDLIGFGKSDKLANWRDYTFELHFKVLEQFIHQLKLTDITLVVQDWGGLLGLSLLGEFPEKFSRVVIMNTALPRGKSLPLGFKAWRLFARIHPSLPVGFVLQMGSYTTLSTEVLNAYKAPFPNKKYKGGAISFPLLVPTKPTDGGVDRMIKAREVLSKWEKPAIILFSDKDFVLGSLASFFYKLIPASRKQQKILIRNAGHFLQEDKGEEIAQYIKQFIKGELQITPLEAET